MGLAADLVTQTAQASGDWPERGGALAQAEAIRDRAVALGGEIERTYEDALEALSRAADRGGVQQASAGPNEAQSSSPALGETLRRVLEALLALADSAADVAQLAELVARSGATVARADAVAATAIATAAAEICVHLVEVNLLVGGDDERSRRARERLAATISSAETARAIPR